MRSKFKFKEKYKVSESLWAYAFIAPTIIGLIIINVIPFLILYFYHLIRLVLLER